MFSFHKPRVFRSAEGCCICGAKSSSSRFTDSGKYEEDSVKCFNLELPRKGEICNACVLLVKRYKRLPSGSNRHWGHVVDARSGPGLKSVNKFKKMKEDVVQQIPEKFSKIFKKTKKAKGAKSENSWDQQSLPPTPESLDSDEEALRQKTKIKRLDKRKSLKPQKYQAENLMSYSFIDDIVWNKKDSCCGPILENKLLESIIFDISNCKPCKEHKFFFFGKEQKQQHQLILSVQSSTRKPQAVALKKHHLFLKRQSENVQLKNIEMINISEVDAKTDLPMMSSSINKHTHNNSSFLRKIKSDTGKILKHSLEKLRITKMSPYDINDINIKHLIKPVEKGCLTTRNNLSNSENTITPKYSDNSSDSGFDENSHDRKSFSPEVEEKSAINVNPQKQQTLYLSSGIEIQGQSQNLILTGNEVAAKIFQSRRSQTKSKK